MFQLLAPTYRVSCVEELTLDQLNAWGLRNLLLDVDCTLKRYRHVAPSPEVLAWIEDLRENDIRLCLVSNGLGARIQTFAESVNLPFVAKALKPLPRGIIAAMQKLNAVPSETAMVGDQLFADILAGRLAGIRTIHVRPIHPEEEPFFTRLKRGPERFIFRRLEP
jgi:HAD superfamily phosphatase (TIGR01668 family)